MRTVFVKCPLCNTVYTKVLIKDSVEQNCCGKHLIWKPKTILYELDLNTMLIQKTRLMRKLFKKEYRFKPKEGFMYEVTETLEQAKEQFKARILLNAKACQPYLIKNGILPETKVLPLNKN